MAAMHASAVTLSGSEKRTRLVIVAPSTNGGDFARAVRIAGSMTRGGFDVEILAWNRSGKKSGVMSDKDLKIQTLDFVPFAGSGMGLALSYLVWWAFAATKLLLGRADVYHAQSLFGLIPTIPANVVKRKAVVFDLIDFVADSFQWPRNIRSFLDAFENFCLQFTDGVVVVDPRKQSLKMEYVKRMAVVTNCPLDRWHALARIPEESRFTVYYGGAILKGRGLAELCETIRNRDDVSVVIAGAGPFESQLRERYGHQTNIRFLGWLEEEQSLEWTKRSHVTYAFYDPHIAINRRAVPAKLYDAMMCARPVLANSEATLVSEVIHRENCGIITPYGDIPALTNAIDALKGSEITRQTMGANGRRAFEREYNWNVMESRLYELYRYVCLAGSTAER